MRVMILAPVVLLLGALGLAGIQDAVDTAPPPPPGYTYYCCCAEVLGEEVCYKKLCNDPLGCSCPQGQDEIDCADMPPAAVEPEFGEVGKATGELALEYQGDLIHPDTGKTIGVRFIPRPPDEPVEIDD